MDRAWQAWVTENIGRGCDTLQLGKILRTNNFTVAQVQEMMGSRCPQNLDLVPNAPASDGVSQNDVDHLSRLRKSVSVLDIQRELRQLSDNGKTIERRRGLSGNEFLEEYYAANRPVILCDLMSLWRAPKKWTPEYLKAAYGHEMVEIMAAREINPEYETDADSHRKNVRFSEFIDMVAGAGDTNDYYLTARNRLFSRPGTEALLKDIEVFTEYLRDASAEKTFLWYGPKGTITPLHHDLMNIFMAQVQGRKHIKLIPANQVDFVYNHFAVYSQVDIGNPDYFRFPKFRRATIIDLELEPGEVLFLPVGWWHWVKALDVSITVTFTDFLFPNEYQWEHPKSSTKAVSSCC
jgi:ribosomal protein L16 Arg81 hydroxylase